MILVDEKDRIELRLNDEDKSELNNMLKLSLTKKQKTWSQKSIEHILLEEFRNGKYWEIFGKPYIVYDIETTSYKWCKTIQVSHMILYATSKR